MATNKLENLNLEELLEKRKKAKSMQKTAWGFGIILGLFIGGYIFYRFQQGREFSDYKSLISIYVICSLGMIFLPSYVNIKNIDKELEERNR